MGKWRQEKHSPQSRTALRGPKVKPPGVGCFQPEGPQDRFHLDTHDLPRAGPSGPGSRHLLFQPPSTHMPIPDSRTPLRVKMALSTLASPQL